MKVYVLLHEDYGWDYCDTNIRGVFLTKEEAESHQIVTKEIKDKRRKKGFYLSTIHGLGCCNIEEYEIGEVDIPKE